MDLTDPGIRPEMPAILAADALSAVGRQPKLPLRGLGLASTALSTASLLAEEGISLRSLTAIGGALGIYAASRFVPGLGWALLAYDAADIATRGLAGMPLAETALGRPIEAVFASATTATQSLTSSLFGSDASTDAPTVVAGRYDDRATTLAAAFDERPPPPHRGTMAEIIARTAAFSSRSSEELHAPARPDHPLER